MSLKDRSRVRTDAKPTDVLRVFSSRAEIRRFYDKISKVYDLLAEKSEEPVRRAGLEQLGAKPGERILEIGPGTGCCLAAMAGAVGPTGWVVGIDLSERMLQQAKGRLRHEGVRDRVGLLCGDATKLPCGDDAFDALLMSFTLELFDTPEIPVVLAECKRVLRPGGRAVVIGMSKEGSEDMRVHILEWTHQHFPNFLDCRPIFVRQALETAGFAMAGSQLKHMWLPVEIVVATKNAR